MFIVGDALKGRGQRLGNNTGNFLEILIFAAALPVRARMHPHW